MKIKIEDVLNTVICGDALSTLKTLSDKSIDCCITSPPYWNLRDYGVKGQLGLEPTFQEYINKLCDIFDEVKRVLKNEGTCWVVIGDTYSGNKEGKTDNKVCDYLKDTTTNLHKKRGSLPDKCLCQIPSRFAIEMSNRGWILRNRIIWHKPNCMPSSVTDRFTVDYEDVFFFVKSKKYYFEQQFEKYTLPMNRWGGIYTDGKCENSKYGGKFRDKEMAEKSGSPRARNLRVGYPERARTLRPNENGKNKRCIWSINTKPFKDAHFATFPEKLIEPMVKSGCLKGGIVLDPFMGAGTTALVARNLGRNYIGIELNKEYLKIIDKRLSQQILI